MKKIYSAPVAEIFQLTRPMCAGQGSIPVDETTITDENKDNVEYNSNSFSGGLLWEEDE